MPAFTAICVNQDSIRSVPFSTRMATAAKVQERAWNARVAAKPNPAAAAALNHVLSHNFGQNAVGLPVAVQRQQGARFFSVARQLLRHVPR